MVAAPVAAAGAAPNRDVRPVGSNPARPLGAAAVPPAAGATAPGNKASPALDRALLAPVLSTFCLISSVGDGLN